MPLIKLNTDATRNQLRVFCAVVVPLLGLIVSAILWSRFGSVMTPIVILTVCAVVATVGLAQPSLVRPLYVGWMYAAYPLGWLVGHIMLAVVFFMVLTPIGLIMRLLGRDPLQREFDTNQPSYWEPLETLTDTQRYFRQF